MFFVDKIGAIVNSDAVQKKNVDIFALSAGCIIKHRVVLFCSDRFIHYSNREGVHIVIPFLCISLGIYWLDLLCRYHFCQPPIE